MLTTACISHQSHGNSAVRVQEVPTMMTARVWQQITNTMPDKFGVFIGVKPFGQAEVWTRVGRAYTNVSKAAQAAASLDPQGRGKSEVRNLRTDRTVWQFGIWLTGSLAQAREAVQVVGRDHPRAARVAHDVMRSLSR
jgi:predicted AAA+ superfamily ATPase